jgi:hypothetical protein
MQKEIERMHDRNSMKRQWPSLQLTVLATTGLAMTYLLSIMFDVRLALILGLFLSSMAAMLYMVFRILKDPYSTDKTFDDYFYQDRDDIRRVGKE